MTDQPKGQGCSIKFILNGRLVFVSSACSIVVSLLDPFDCSCSCCNAIRTMRARVVESSSIYMRYNFFYYNFLFREILDGRNDDNGNGDGNRFNSDGRGDDDVVTPDGKLNMCIIGLYALIIIIDFPAIGKVQSIFCEIPVRNFKVLI